MIAARPMTAQGAAQAPAQQPPAAQPKPEVDAFQANSPSRHERTFETIYNGVGALGVLTDIASKTGQALSIAGPLAGFQAGGLASAGALVAGTLDIARGASHAKQAAINRDSAGSLQGSIQVVQGLATYATALAPAFGAPPVVSAVCAGLAVAAFAAQKGVGAYGAAKAKAAAKAAEKNPAISSTPAQPQAPAAPTQPLALASAPSGATGLATTEKAELDPDRNRHFEKSFAFVNSVDQFFRGIGGLASFWNVAGAVTSGTASGGLFGIPGLGFVGTAYSVATGVAMTKHSAMNRNMDGTVDGALQTIGGLAATAVCAGGGRIPALVAAGCFVARTAYQIYSQSQKLKGDKDKDGEKKSMPLIIGQAIFDTANPFVESRGMDKAAL